MVNSIQNNMINSYTSNFKQAKTNNDKPKKESTLSDINSHPEKINKLNYSPATVGILNGLCWTTIGMGFEMIWSKLFKSKINTKVSLAINSLLGLGMGIYAYKLAKKEAANQQN